MSSRYQPDRLRQRLVQVRIASFYRVIRKEYRADPLGVVPRPSRFSDPRNRYAVLYASSAARCSFWESIARSRFTHKQKRELPISVVTGMRVVTISTTEPLLLLDLRDDGPIRIAAPTAVAHDSNHAAGRALSSAAHAGLPEADGFLFNSRFTGHACIAVFDRATAKFDVEGVDPLIENLDFLTALDDYEITLVDTGE